MSSQTQILPFALLFCVSDTIYPEVSAAEAPGMPDAERDSYQDIVLVGRLQVALDRLNPDATAEGKAEALRQLLEPAGGSQMGVNHAMHRLITGGVRVDLPDGLGGVRAEHLRVLNFDKPGDNSLLAVNQLTIVEGHP